MTQRKYCEHCHYPKTTCICSNITKLNVDIAVSILQDPSEQKHAKNTARLVPLILPQAEIFIGLMPNDFVSVRQKINSVINSVVVYPNNNAKSLDGKTPQAQKYNHIIIIDGSWRKAKKLWLNNPWLHSLNSVSLNSTESSQYHIRKAPFANSFSTIEALAMTLAAFEICDTEPFYQALHSLQSHWRGG
jgi:DTW domain-containing protein YfiP